VVAEIPTSEVSNIVSNSSKRASSIFLPVNKEVSSVVNFSLVLVRPFFILSAKPKKPPFFSSFGGAFSSLISGGLFFKAFGGGLIEDSGFKAFFFFGRLGVLVTICLGAAEVFFSGFLTTSFFTAGFFSGLSFLMIFFGF
jgi:hypothetical protein